MSAYEIGIVVALWCIQIVRRLALKEPLVRQTDEEGAVANDERLLLPVGRDGEARRLADSLT